MLLDEKEADAEAHEAEKDALWRRIEVTVSKQSSGFFPLDIS